MTVEELTLNTHTYGGETLGRLADGRAVFVPHTLPGEKVRIETVIEKPRYAKARMLEILNPSPERITPRCPHFGVCGGCHYQHLSYENQLIAKTDILIDQLKRIGKIEDPPVEAVVPSPQPWGYRVDAQFHISTAGQLGFQAAHAQGIVPIDECPVLAPAIDQLKPQIDIESIPGLERVSLRMGSGEDMMLIFESSDPEPFSMNLDFPISVIHRGPKGYLVLAGEDFVVTKVKERAFRISAGSAFRIHPQMGAAIVDTVLDGLPLTPSSTVLFAYAGIGLISAFTAPHVRRLVAIESSPSAGNDFAINLDEFENVDLYQAAVENVLPTLDLKPDYIVVEPPRSGIERHALDGMLALAPGIIVYISTDPSTLARDAQRLSHGGYSIQRLIPFDLFPQTYHIESISFWEKS
ncbi:MAG: class I SAM-dependent RNA methyltransferase [Chloroflexota bacterium]